MTGGMATIEEWAAGVIGRRVFHRRADLFGRVEAIRLELSSAAVRYEWPHDGKDTVLVPLIELYDAVAVEVDAAVGRLEKTLLAEKNEATMFTPPGNTPPLKLAGGTNKGKLPEPGELEEKLVTQLRQWYRRSAFTLKLDEGYRCELKFIVHTPETADDDALWLHAEVEEVVRTDLEGDVPGMKGPSADG